MTKSNCLNIIYLFSFSSSNQEEEEKNVWGEFVDFSCIYVGIIHIATSHICKRLWLFNLWMCCVVFSLTWRLCDGECSKSWKLIIFRFTHFFSFIHLARLCIVYYFCRFSPCPSRKKSLRDLARVYRERCQLRIYFGKKLRKKILRRTRWVDETITEKETILKITLTVNILVFFLCVDWRIKQKSMNNRTTTE